MRSTNGRIARKASLTMQAGRGKRILDTQYGSGKDRARNRQSKRIYRSSLVLRPMYRTAYRLADSDRKNSTDRFHGKKMPCRKRTDSPEFERPL
eukprot:5880996-Pyramimonas_sp.AAC.1